MAKYLLFLLLMLASIANAQETNVNDQVYKITEVDVKPEFKGGVQNFYNYISKNFRIPDVEGLEGKIMVEFVIEKDGAISNVDVIKDVGYGTAEQMTELLENSPNWIPGKKDGETVRTLYRIPISIKSGR